MKKTEMPVCKEMKKLRKWLDDNKIPWLDASDCSKLGGRYHGGCAALIFVSKTTKYL